MLHLFTCTATIHHKLPARRKTGHRWLFARVSRVNREPVRVRSGTSCGSNRDGTLLTGVGRGANRDFTDGDEKGCRSIPSKVIDVFPFVRNAFAGNKE